MCTGLEAGETEVLSKKRKVSTAHHTVTMTRMVREKEVGGKVLKHLASPIGEFYLVLSQSFLWGTLLSLLFVLVF